MIEWVVVVWGRYVGVVRRGVIGGAGLGRRAYLVLFKTFNTFLDFQGVTVRPDSCLPEKSKVVIN